MKRRTLISSWTRGDVEDGGVVVVVVDFAVPVPVRAAFTLEASEGVAAAALVLVGGRTEIERTTPAGIKAKRVPRAAMQKPTAAKQ